MKALLDRMLDSATVSTKSRAISDSLNNRIQLVEDVLPESLKGQATRIVKRAMLTFNSNAELQQCPPDQFIRCVLRAAEMGLAIDGKLCYVVRYKGVWQTQADYKGLVAVAKRSGLIRDCKADVVYDADRFSFYHDSGRDHLVHTPDLLAENRGRVIAAYCSLILPDNSFRAYVLSRAELDKIRQAAPAKNGPWSGWTEEMQKKSAVRRALKMYCDDPGVLSALAAEDEFEEPLEPASAPLPEGRLDLRPKRVPEPADVPAGDQSVMEQPRDGDQ